MVDRASSCVLTREDARRLDTATIEHGVTSLDLMERAGGELARFVVTNAAEICQRELPACPRVLILCGGGSNGGDGFVVARLLKREGWQIVVALCKGSPASGSDACTNLERWRAAGGEVVDRDVVLRMLREMALGREESDYDFVLDAIFGTGLDRPLEDALIEIVRALDDCGVPTVAVDIPSGLCANTGKPLGAAVRAKATATIGTAKPGLFVARGPDFVGKLTVLDIGLVEPTSVGISVVGTVIDAASVAEVLPRRATTSHKGDMGHVLVCGGSAGKSGAVLLGARAALRCGAGLVTMAVSSSLATAADLALWEAMTVALADAGSGEIASGAFAALEKDVSRYATAAVGPGLGLGSGAAELVADFVNKFPGSLILDADALTLLANADGAAAALGTRNASGLGPVVLTPHPGEMARLLGTTAAAVQADRIGAVRGCLARYPGVTVVLKGAATIVAGAEALRFNTSGNPGMAAPGMGDVLAGALAALLARGDGVLDAACLAVYVHGCAGDLLAEDNDGAGFFASEVADALPLALAEIAHAGWR